MKRLPKLLILVAGIGLFGLLFLANQVLASFPHTSTRLSGNDDVCDIEPRAAISPDGEWIASTWIRAQKVNDGCKSVGNAVLRWATENNALQTWSYPVVLNMPTADTCAIHTDIAITGTTAHVAVATWQPCSANEANSAIRYYACNMTTGVCSTGENAVSETGASTYRLYEARLTLDGAGQPHIVYSRAHHDLSGSQILYARKTTGIWTTVQQLSLDAEKAYRPVIAAAKGRVHFAWEVHTDYIDRNQDPRGNGYVRYRYCLENGTCPTNGQTTFPSPYSPGSAFPEGTYPIPAISAVGDQALLTWNICGDYNENKPCNYYHLLYAQINFDEQGLMTANNPREAITDAQYRSSVLRYRGTDGVYSEYEKYLRPNLQLNGDGLPVLIWQMQTTSGGYVLTTTQAITRYDTGFAWTQQAWEIGTGEANDERLLPTVLIAPTSQDPNGIHIIYMKTWQDNALLRAQIYYDYFGDRRLSGIAFEGESRTSPLPEGRGQLLRIHAVNGSGTGVAGAAIIAKTDYGSFDSYSSGVAQASALTNQEGWAELMIYANLTGTAHIEAWVDNNGNATLDTDEPSDTFEQSWNTTTTPALYAVTNPVMAGYLITSTVQNHPFDENLSYALWWCTDNGTQVAKRLTPPSPFLVDYNTWDLENVLIRVPWNVAGLYHLETHKEYGVENACGDPNSLMARSGQISATTTYPAGPLVLVSDDTPNPGMVVTATLLQHDALENPHSLWWCPIEGLGTGRSLATGIIVNNQGTYANANLQIPSPAAGTYRIESHTGAGGCNQSATLRGYVIIDPSNQIFLPIVLRKSQ